MRRLILTVAAVFAAATLDIGWAQAPATAATEGQKLAAEAAQTPATTAEAVQNPAATQTPQAQHASQVPAGTDTEPDETNIESIMDKGFYDFNALSLQGNELSMSDFKGKVVVVVNTASKCGFTPQYAGLQALHEKYADRGLVILGFPCNQFAGQEPGDEASIAEGCLLNYGVDFQMFSKVKVNGKEAHPLFVWLKNSLRGPLGPRVEWNFVKFVVDRNGVPVKRYGPRDTPENMEEYLVGLL